MEISRFWVHRSWRERAAEIVAGSANATTTDRMRGYVVVARQLYVGQRYGIHFSELRNEKW